MTVYELIQELSNYNADTEVRFKVNDEFDDYVYFEDVSDYERDRYRPCIEINLEY